MNTQLSMAQRLGQLRRDKSLNSTAMRMPTIAEMTAREQQLERVQTEMIAEFAGLDAQIRSVFKFMKPWWLLPQAQRRPVVISLWGMTGVGKSSFVLRLIDKLNLVEQFAQVDLTKIASADGGPHAMNFPSSFSRLANGPCVLFLDEIHRARTIDEMGAEVDRPALSDYWTLIDSGMVTTQIDDLRSYGHQISRDLKMLQENPELVGGASSMDAYVLEMITAALGLAVDGLELSLIAQEDPLAFLDFMSLEIKRVVRSSSPMDFRQGLIFVAGNLDEAFVDNGSVSPEDMNAEDLHKRTSRVSVDLIKQCLLRRFRPEQVSRLGSMQIIFPSLSKASFKKLIAGRLQTICEWTLKGFRTRLSFADSVVDLILHEGVIASQGARPVLTTITDLVEGKLPTWLLEASRHDYADLHVRYQSQGQKLILENRDGQEIFTEVLVLRDQRLPVIEISEALRHVIAVHEAGHAVVGIVREGRLPIKILTGPKAWHHGGPRVVFGQIPAFTRELGQQLLEVSLGGMVAEQIVFGKDHHSQGCSQDLQDATDRAVHMITQLGMGSHIGVTLPEHQRPGNLVSAKPEDDELVERWLRQARQKAAAAIASQMELFEALSQELMRADRLTGKDLQRLVKDHYVGPKREVDAILTREEPRALERLRPKTRLRRAG